MNNTTPKTPPRIIGLSGKFGVGKDTAAAFIKEAYPKYSLRAIAANLKRAVALITGTSEESQYTREGKEYVPPGFANQSIGYYQQKLGQYGREIFGPNVWINSVIGGNEPIVITDVRYPNEADAILAAGGIVIRIVRDGVVLNDGRDVNHISETALDDYDKFSAVIHNNGTIDQYRDLVLYAVKYLDKMKAADM
jgi:hypothetical protein